MYPGLPYMERIATKHDLIPLGKPVIDRYGRKLQEIKVAPGQVCTLQLDARMY